MAAGRSAVPAADASAVMAITSPTGPSTLTASREGEHHRPSDHIAGQEHGSSVVAVGDHAAEGTEEDVREQSTDRGRADPPRRPGGLVDVREEGGVVQPVPQLRRGARADQRSGLLDGEDVPVCGASVQGGRP